MSYDTGIIIIILIQIINFSIQTQTVTPPSTISFVPNLLSHYSITSEINAELQLIQKTQKTQKEKAVRNKEPSNVVTPAAPISPASTETNKLVAGNEERRREQKVNPKKMVSQDIKINLGSLSGQFEEDHHLSLGEERTYTIYNIDENKVVQGEGKITKLDLHPTPFSLKISGYPFLQEPVTQSPTSNQAKPIQPPQLIEPFQNKKQPENKKQQQLKWNFRKHQIPTPTPQIQQKGEQSQFQPEQQAATQATTQTKPREQAATQTKPEGEAATRSESQTKPQLRSETGGKVNAGQFDRVHFSDGEGEVEGTLSVDDSLMFFILFLASSGLILLSYSPERVEKGGVRSSEMLEEEESNLT